MDQKILEKINSETNIIDLVSQYVELQKAGKNFKGLCLAHQLLLKGSILLMQ